jgi:hypothetical protein
MRRTLEPGSASMAMTSDAGITSRSPARSASSSGRPDEHDVDAELVGGAAGALDDLAGALSPPMASMAIGSIRSASDSPSGSTVSTACEQASASVDVDGLAAVVPPAVAAHHVGRLAAPQRGQTLRAGRSRRQARPGGCGSSPWRSSSWGRPSDLVAHDAGRSPPPWGGARRPRAPPMSTGPSTSSRQRRQAPDQRVVTVPVAVMPPSIDSSIPSKATSWPCTRAELISGPRQRSLDPHVALRAQPATQSETPTTRRAGHPGDYPRPGRRPRAPPAGPRARPTPRGAVQAGVDGPGAGPLQLGPPRRDHLHGALEDDLEAGQLLVAEVLASLRRRRASARRPRRSCGPGLGGLDHLGALHHRSARARAWSRISSPSRRTLARNSSRSLSSHRAARSSSGRRSMASSSSSRTSSRLIITEVDSGMGRAARHEVVETPERASTSGPARRGGLDGRGVGRSSSSATGRSVLPAAAWPRRRHHLVTSPPKRAISRMSLDATKECSDAEGMNRVSTPEIARFIWACCSSDSKSDTARRPLTMKSAPTSRARSTTRLEN